MNQCAINQPSSSFPYIVSRFTCAITPESEFSFAANSWMESRSIKALPGAKAGHYIRKTTEDSYRKYIRTLELFFAGYRLGDIQLGHLEAYQRARLQGDEPFVRFRRPQDAKPKIKNGIEIPAKGKTPCPVKPQKINQELGILTRLLRRASCWSDELENFYQPLLNDEEEVLRALNPEEQRKWLDVARLKKEWNLVYWYSIVAFGTCMSTDELRGLRLGDINMFQRVVTVARKTAKNGHRARTIELTGADVLWAMEQLLSRAKELGATDPYHYLFPGREHIGKYDPDTPMSGFGLNKYWNEVRESSGLKWFRQYDCRHTAITRLAEAGVPTDVIMSRAGHVSEKMRRHYTHISQASQRKWLEHSQRFHHVMPAASAIQFPPPPENSASMGPRYF